jgi:VWFA-related protein
MVSISEARWGSTSVVICALRACTALFVLVLAGSLSGQSPPTSSPPSSTQANAPQPATQSNPQSAPAGTPQSAPQNSGPSVPTNTPPTSTQTANAPAQEISTHDEVTTFKVKVNLVLVRVVVRDSKGKAVGNLHKEDFELFDNKKPQTITQFVMEQPGSKAAAAQQTAEQRPLDEQSGSPLPPPVPPDHYVAYVFDDVHLAFGDLARVRDAAARHMDTLKPTDRAAIFTTSGQGSVDFTDDRAKLHEALQHLLPRPVTRTGITECPDVTLYMADLIQNQNDPNALQVATLDALHCAFNDDDRMLRQATTMAQNTAAQVLSTGEQETRVTLSVLKDTIRHVSAMPGVRTVLLLSPGFLAPRMDFDYSQIIDSALRAQVVISALDARGVYVVDPAGDISDPHPVPPQVAGQKAIYLTDAASADDNILADLAYGTGGSFVKNNNDLDVGMQRIAAEPDYWYVLGFAPQNLKLDGHFHAIKVTVKNPPKAEVQARKGYYAPRHEADPNEQAKEEIEDALFSQEEMRDLPVDLHTQFFKSTDVEAKLAVLCHVDVTKMHFQHTGGRNANNLTIVSGLFDRNGKFITGNQKILEMHLKDDTLSNRLRSGITIRSSFDVKPGSYLVRLVVRDAEGQLYAANGAIEIP